MSDLYNIFDQRLVGADLGTLQPADVFTNPGDEGKLGSLAHGVSCCDSDKAKHACIVWEKTNKKSFGSQDNSR